MRNTWLRVELIAVLVVVAVLGGGLALTVQAAGASSYKGQTRDFTVVEVPLLVHEQASMLDYLNADFAKGGLLDGKEVYGFMPSTLVVYQGDTVNLTLVNPADDDHTFTISDLNLSVTIKGQTSTKATVKADTVGVYTYTCAEDEHMPYRWGQLLVLPASAAPGA